MSINTDLSYTIGNNGRNQTCQYLLASSGYADFKVLKAICSNFKFVGSLEAVKQKSKSVEFCYYRLNLSFPTLTVRLNGGTWSHL